MGRFFDLIAGRNRFSKTDGRDRAAHLLTRYYGLTLGLIAVLLLLDRLMVQPPLLRLLTDAPVINIAKRQRMLSQRLTRTALALELADASDRERYYEELDQVLNQWTASHEALRRGRADSSLPGHKSGSVQRAFDALEPSYRKLRGAAARALQGRSSATDVEYGTREGLLSILENESQYLSRLDQVVDLYEHESQARLGHLIRIGWAVTVLIVALWPGSAGSSCDLQPG